MTNAYALISEEPGEQPATKTAAKNVKPQDPGFGCVYLGSLVREAERISALLEDSRIRIFHATHLSEAEAQLKLTGCARTAHGNGVLTGKLARRHGNDPARQTAEISCGGSAAAGRASLDRRAGKRPCTTWSSSRSMSANCGGFWRTLTCTPSQASLDP